MHLLGGDACGLPPDKVHGPLLTVRGIAAARLTSEVFGNSEDEHCVPVRRGLRAALLVVALTVDRVVPFEVFDVQLVLFEEFVRFGEEYLGFVLAVG